MDIDNLKTFIKVAETRSFSKSADAMHLTQPAISKRIAALESRLETKLFDRVGRNIHLTEAGEILLPGAKHIQLELSRIEETFLQTGDTITGELIIGTTENCATKQLAPLLSEFRHSHPEVKINLCLHDTEAALTQLNDSNVELVLCPLHKSAVEQLPTSLRCIELWRNDLKVVTHKNSALSKKDTVTPNDLAMTNAILPPPETLARKAIDQILAGNAMNVNVSVQAYDFATMKSLAAIGLGWTCLPEREIDDSVAIVPIENLRFPHSIVLIRSRERTLSKAAEAFLNFLPALSPQAS